jgi:hypothetical protein
MAEIPGQFSTSSLPRRARMPSHEALFNSFYTGRRKSLADHNSLSEPVVSRGCEAAEAVVCQSSQPGD